MEKKTAARLEVECETYIALACVLGTLKRQYHVDNKARHYHDPEGQISEDCADSEFYGYRLRNLLKEIAYMKDLLASNRIRLKDTLDSYDPKIVAECIKLRMSK